MELQNSCNGLQYSWDDALILMMSGCVGEGVGPFKLNGFFLIWAQIIVGGPAGITNMRRGVVTLV